MKSKVQPKVTNDSISSTSYLDVLLKDQLNKIDAQAGAFARRVDDKKQELRHELNQLSDDKAKFSKTKFTSAKLKKRKEKVVTDPWSMTKNVQFSLPPIHNLAKGTDSDGKSRRTSMAPPIDVQVSLLQLAQHFNVAARKMKRESLEKSNHEEYMAQRLKTLNSYHSNWNAAGSITDYRLPTPNTPTRLDYEVREKGKTDNVIQKTPFITPRQAKKEQPEKPSNKTNTSTDLTNNKD